MTCPRCAGLSVPVWLLDGEAELPCWRCVCCGHHFGEPTLDLHHSLERPPEPTRPAILPVWDPRVKRIRWPAPSAPSLPDPGV
jgi:hypothetical protein